MELAVANTSVVVPAKPIREHWMLLSNLDRLVMPTYVRVLLVYSLSRGGESKQEEEHQSCSYARVLQTLKDSLARALVDFYPMAGRLGVQDDGLVNLHCNGAGAIFSEAFSNQPLSNVELASNMCHLSGIQAANLAEGPHYVPSRETQIPALIVQVTHFRCDNLVLAVNWHHTVADIYSGCHFLKSWAELASGRTSPSLRPVHSRSLVQPRNELDVTLAERWARLARVSRATVEHVEDVPSVLRAFDLSHESALRLQETIRSESEGTSSHQTNVSIGAPDSSVLAQLWRLLAKARRAEEPDDSDNASRLFMFVEGRSFLNLPRGYFGNVVGCACARSTEENLMNGSLSSIARLIQSAVAEISCTEFFQSLIDWVEAQWLSSARQEHGLSMEHYVAATLWTFAPFYDLDFGWGKPSFALTNPAPRRFFDGLVILPGPHAEADKTALIQMRGSCLNRLKDDPEFETLCTPSRFPRTDRQHPGQSSA
ncbi:hypothetical protein R1flu_025285 [Riccia fluitans]|uniref:Uncharacterized protein n=1 Tax=Riccia fluitans TaxID=41844 RepID=A0ABD1XY83_9MARC